MSTRYKWIKPSAQGLTRPSGAGWFESKLDLYKFDLHSSFSSEPFLLTVDYGIFWVSSINFYGPACRRHQ